MKQEDSPKTQRRRAHRSTSSGGPVPLYKRSRSHFGHEEKERGAEIFAADRVRLELGENRARAVVTEADKASYRVGVDWTRVANRRLHTYCECPRFAGGDFCRHVWAVLKALAEEGPEQQPPGRDRLGVRRDRADVWEELGLEVGRNSVRSVRDVDGGHAARDAEGGGKRSVGAGEGSDRKRRGRLRSASTPWRSQMISLRDEIGTPAIAALPTSAQVRSVPVIHFFINTAASYGSGGLVLDVFGGGAAVAGRPSKLKRASLDPGRLEELLLPRNSNNGAAGAAAIRLALISEVGPAARGRKAASRRGRATAAAGIRRFRLPPQLYDTVLPHLCSKGILGWWDGRVQKNLHPLWWDSGTAWRVTLELEMSQAGVSRISGRLEREGENVSIMDPVLILPPGDSGSRANSASLVVFPESIGRLEIDRQRDLPWITLLRSGGEMVIPRKDVEEAVTELLELPALPHLDIPDELDLFEEASPPQPRLVLEPSPVAAQTSLTAEISFDYGPMRVKAEDSRSAIVDWQERTLLRRDLDGEHAALVRLLELGLRPVESSEGHVRALELAATEVPRVIEPLLVEGWAVEVQGSSVVAPNPPSLRIESGIDWFDVSGEVDFAGDRLELPRVLDAVARGERFVRLEDGSRGLLPAEWMETYDSLSKLARGSTDEGLRFLPSQALIVDALLSAMPPADVDGAFAKLRDRLTSFERLKPKRELKSFEGTLRSYQRDGLGWLDFLREFGLGGVLADDMGLGKTIQVLALVQVHRTPAKTSKLPFLVVAPRSVVYNWVDEASRFTPKLRVTEYHGAGREDLQGRFDEYDIVVTTYGTLRRDISYLATVEFDTVILDEAQAIKNATSQTAKASRLLTARHRLALTGTPIENHLGELGSIFEFLNPGLLGRLPRLEVLNGGRAPTKQELEMLARDLRPFILRRTKKQVLPDLPPKTEQILFCELREEQRELYDRLRATYQASLLEQVEASGVGGSAMQVLEALLRLRQVACHPGLVEPEWESAGSAKLEALHEQVSEVLDEGHKVLVFSQFTSLLAYVRRDLEDAGVPYAYLDGQTRNRGEIVDRFQNDSECNVFLISLKAGGVGLNLTAAGYVFLLDPWWNPAVEAQAIDRTHRIGQTQAVFAYRMIARDTVEEKLLELQRSKRKLADAILDAEGRALRDLTADDLRLLLS